MTAKQQSQQGLVKIISKIVEGDMPKMKNN